MPLVEVQPRAEITPGTYEAVVSSVEKDTIVPRTGRNAGQDVPILRWNFLIEGVEDRIESITSRDPSSPKSNLFAYFVALLGSDKKAWLEAENEDLIGRKCLVTVSVNDEGWPKVDNVSGMPVRRAGVTPAEVAAAPAAVEDENLQGDLPF